MGLIRKSLAAVTFIGFPVPGGRATLISPHSKKQRQIRETNRLLKEQNELLRGRRK